jgi:hypothetical protein
MQIPKIEAEVQSFHSGDVEGCKRKLIIGVPTVENSEKFRNKQGCFKKTTGRRTAH